MIADLPLYLVQAAAVAFVAACILTGWLAFLAQGYLDNRNYRAHKRKERRAKNAHDAYMKELDIHADDEPARAVADGGTVTGHGRAAPVATLPNDEADPDPDTDAETLTCAACDCSVPDGSSHVCSSGGVPSPIGAPARRTGGDGT